MILALSCASLLSAQTTPHLADHFQAARPVTQTIQASAAMKNQLDAGPRNALSLAAGDFFEDGANALVTGYSLAGGGVIAVQRGMTTLPRAPETFLPFQAAANLIDAGTRPDVLTVADLNGDGHQDLVVATRGATSFNVLFGDGRGNFSLQPSLPVLGSISSVATLKGPAGRSLIAIGACGTTCSLQLYLGDGTVYASIALPDQPSLLHVARLNGSPSEDLLVGGSAGLFVLDGRTLTSASPQLDRIPVSGAVAVATGSFVYDERGFNQAAVLTADGSIHTFTRSGSDAKIPTLGEAAARIATRRTRKALTPIRTDPSTLPWVETEVLSGVAPPSSNATPLLLQSLVSGSGMQDLVVLNVSGGQVVTIAHPVVGTPRYTASGDPVDDAAPSLTLLPARVDIESGSLGTVAAAIPLRVSQDGRLGLVAASTEAHTNVIATPATSRDIYVTSNLDTAPAAINAAVTACTAATSPGANTTCTLRGAIRLVNNDASANEASGKIDTIHLAATTYTLTQFNTGPTDSQLSVDLHLDIAGPVNILGAAASTTIITSNNLDKIFSINPGIPNNASAFDTFFSNLTLTNGTNTNTQGDAGAEDYLGGLVDGDTEATGYVTFTNCNLTNGTDLFGDGGAISINNYTGNTSGPGALEIDNSTLSGNKTSIFGGAVSSFTGGVQMIFNNDSFTSNQTNPALLTNSSLNYGNGSGGAVFSLADSNVPPSETQILTSTFSNNTARSKDASDIANGGAVSFDDGVIITNSTFTGNVTGGYGGAIATLNANFPSTFKGLTVTGNTASTNGGGIFIDGESAPAASVTYSRITGNTGSGGISGLEDGKNSGTTQESITATDNFWGCNGAATGTGCDTVGVIGKAGSGTVNVTPYAVVTAGVNSTTPAPGTSLTLTGGITTDSAGATIAPANLTAFAGLNAVMNISQNSSTIASATTATNAAATASLSTAITNGGAGTTSFRIDNATVTGTFNVTVASPTIAIAFSPTSVALNGTSTLTFTLTNPNAGVAATGVAFSDTLPSGLVVATPASAVNNCGGTLTSAPGTGTISLSAATINAATACTVSVNVTPTTAGNKSNTTGAITSTNESSSGVTSNTAILTVLQPITIAEAFGATTIPRSGTTSLTFTLANPTTTAQTAVAFSDSLPVGLMVATPSALTNTCNGTAVAVAGSATITLTAGTLSPSASCAVVLNVTSATAGTYTNTTGTISSTPNGTGSTATASLTVLAPPTLSAAYTSTQVLAGGTASLTITFTNPNTTTLTGLSLLNTLPAGFTYSTSSTTCSSATISTPTASTQSLGGGTLPGAASCSFSVNAVAGTTPGSFTDNTGNVSSTNGGTGSTAFASINLVAVPVLTFTTPPLINRGSTSGITATYTVTAGSLAPTASFALYNGATLVSSAPATLTLPTTYTVTLPVSALPSGSLTLTVKYPGDTNYPSAATASQVVTVIANDIWIGNGNHTTSALLYNGSLLLTTPETSGGGPIAIDSLGNVWSLNATTSSIAKFTSAGALTSAGYTGGGLSSPTSIAIDGAGTVWITNSNNSVSVFTPTGAPFSPTAYTGSISTPTSIAIDSSGNLWIVNQGDNSVTEMLGTAAPTVSPLSTGVASNTTGIKP